MFNREKISELPKMQIDFINGICQPIFVQFYKIFDGKFEFRDYLLINKLNWLRLAFESDQLKEWAEMQSKKFEQELKEMGIDVEEIQKEANLQFIEYENKQKLLNSI